MKISNAIINAVRYIPQKNEPYKTPSIVITKITHFYKDGGYDEWFNTMFGIEARDEFYTILDCTVTVIIDKVITDSDKYYERNDFKNACYNRGEENPYQLPKWTELKD